MRCVCVLTERCSIGLDVSHPTPGSPMQSMAAMTFSTDKHACRYAAIVQTNGRRVEMLSKENVEGMFVKSYSRWYKEVNGGVHPDNIFFFRDGVSERQFSQVLEYEVAEMKQALNDCQWNDPKANDAVRKVTSESPSFNSNHTNDKSRLSGLSQFV